jgi:hypothetical protein
VYLTKAQEIETPAPPSPGVRQLHGCFCKCNACDAKPWNLWRAIESVDDCIEDSGMAILKYRDQADELNKRLKQVMVALGNAEKKIKSLEGLRKQLMKSEEGLVDWWDGNL